MKDIIFFIISITDFFNSNSNLQDILNWKIKKYTHSNLTLASARNFLSKSQRKKTSRLKHTDRNCLLAKFSLMYLMSSDLESGLVRGNDYSSPFLSLFLLFLTSAVTIKLKHNRTVTKCVGPRQNIKKR